jgi:AmmeMemoRadiSam system protein B
MRREMSVNGAFYPNEKSEIEATFNYFNELTCKHFESALYHQKAKAIVVPHAGYVYSGFSANLAYKNVNFTPKRVVVIGPSHRVSFEGMSLVDFTSYATPLGDIKADDVYGKKLKNQFLFHSVPSAHAEHSTEVQFPFIKHYFPDSMLIEIVYSHHIAMDLLLEELLTDAQTLLVISTDLSHFYKQKEANALDANCIKAFESLDVSYLQEGEACGMGGLAALIRASKKLSLTSQSIDYRTSGDITKEYERVVGYFSGLIY